MATTGCDIRKLYGVGDVRAKAYARMKIYTVSDLLEHYPRGYENRGDVIPLTDADGLSKHAHILTVATEPRVTRIKGRMTLLQFRAFDESGTCTITFFNQNFLKDTFPIGATFRFYGKVERSKKGLTMSSPAYELWQEDVALPPLCSVYPLTEGISRKQIQKDIAAALTLASLSQEQADFLDEEMRARLGLCTRGFALRNIHLPDSFSSLALAKKRLIFDEFFTFATGLGLAGAERQKNAAYPCQNADVRALLSLLPYDLTGAQKRVIAEIAADMQRDVAMNRMVVGDVGCGKTVCAAAAILMAVQSGRQAAMMAPTEILARQHYADFSTWFDALGIRCALLVGAMSAAEKKRVHAGLCDPDPDKRIQVVVGTQALLSEGVGFAAPGLVVTDEQHRFGVDQRATLADKSSLTHMLVMSATPIPRTLALSLYGDLDVSRIDEMPAGRQKVDTFVVDESYRERLYVFIDKQIREGGQVYVVCPAVDEADDEDGQTDLYLSDVDAEGGIHKRRAPMRSAVQTSEELASRFPEHRVAFLHGKMKPKEKDAVMQEFAAGRIDILVSTTVIEVGVNVPNATLMIVEDADRFGLSQLHQLRGRVGRGKRKSFCVLVSDAAGKESTAGERLSVMKTCYDGYAIAERDLAMRGPGDFLRAQGEESVRQSGGVRFRLAELCDDTGLMSQAFAEARTLLQSDPTLSEHPHLKAYVDRLFLPEKGTIN